VRGENRFTRRREYRKTCFRIAAGTGNSVGNTATTTALPSPSQLIEGGLGRAIRVRESEGRSLAKRHKGRASRTHAFRTERPRDGRTGRIDFSPWPDAAVAAAAVARSVSPRYVSGGRTTGRGNDTSGKKTLAGRKRTVRKGDNNGRLRCLSATTNRSPTDRSSATRPTTYDTGECPDRKHTSVRPLSFGKWRPVAADFLLFPFPCFRSTGRPCFVRPSPYTTAGTSSVHNQPAHSYVHKSRNARRRSSSRAIVTRCT